VLLAAEIADSSLLVDRGVKLPMYARAGIPEVWLVDLVADAIDVHRQPSPGGYGLVSTHRPGAVISPAGFTDVAIDVAEVLGV
jgi:Uma2 family endonuclease